MATNVQQLLKEDPSDAAKRAAKKARYAELRTKLGRPKLEVQGKPGIHYFWADNVNDQGEVIRLSGAGYFIVREPNVKEVLAGKAQPEIIANGLKEDGTYIIGDVILMGCPEEIYEFMGLDVSERHEALSASAIETFEVQAEQVGAPTFRVAEPARRK